jgi:hypothetical protein
MKHLTIHKLLPALMLTVALGSCSKGFLDTTPQQSTDLNNVVVDLPSTRGAINGIYSLMKSADYYGRTMFVNADLMADNAYISKKNSGRYLPNDQYGITSNDSRVRATWNQLYLLIANANILIEKGEALQLPASEEAEKKHILGEAYTLRALAYLDLARTYAQPYNFTPDASHLGVPVVTVTKPDNSSIISPKRSTAKETYKQIVDDLVKATTLLTASPVGFSSSNKGKITLNGARALLSRVYLYMEDWTNAEAMATEVISANKYSLIARDKLLTDFGLQNNSETIFEVHYLTTDNLGSDQLTNFTLQSGSYGDLLATDDLYNSYDAADARRGFLIKGKRSGSGGENPAVIINKYNNITTFEEGIKVMRLAEVYLNRAEARAMQPGKEADAVADIDMIKKRAFATPAPTTETGAALLQLIRNERRRELPFEGHRLFDLTRWKQDFTKDRSGNVTISIGYPNLKTIMPIPLSEINANPNIEPNDGYGN